jgi:NAD+ synthase
MSHALHIALAQVNPIIGAFSYNLEKIKDYWTQANDKADLIVFPETVITGYAAEDLWLKPSFIERTRQYVDLLIAYSKDMDAAALITAPWVIDGQLMNCALLIEKGSIFSTIAKSHLPNYGVFDEDRYFKAGALPRPVTFRGFSLGILICEDVWSPEAALHLKEHGAKILIAPNASPFAQNKHQMRINVARARATETSLPMIYVNQVGGQDDLVFDGGSFIMMETGNVIFQGERFTEGLYFVTLEPTPHDNFLCIAPESIKEPDSEIYEATVLGLRDYVTKNGFPSVILGMSGGVDSALCATIAVDALGPDMVRAVMMPSEFTSDESLRDAKDCSDALGIHHDTISIEKPIMAFEANLDPFFNQGTPSITFENLQSRARGVTLMALSNATGAMVLSTGNKSENAVGYATLYGDMCGGYNPIKDIYKTEVYKLCAWRNENRPTNSFGPSGIVIPQNILTKAPTAELRPNQTDQDSLPPYEILDAILRGLVEDNLGLDDLLAQGFDRATIIRVWQLLDRAEYKRRQACPGPRISSCAFSRERRYPITNHFVKHIEK